MNNKDKVVNRDLARDNEKKKKVVVEKKKYVMPEIQFISLKVEERLMECGKMDLDCPGPQSTKLS